MTRARLLTTLAQLADPEQRAGTAVGRASGVLIASMVLSFFLGVGLSAGMLEGTALDAVGWTALLLVPVGLSLIFTALTNQLAVRASSTRDAVLALFLGMVCPPFTVFLVTLYGAFFAAGAGMLAFFITLPVVLAARHGRRRHETGPHEALIGATALTAGSVVTLLVQACIFTPELAADMEVWPMFFPPALAAGAALHLAMPIVRRQTARRSLVDAVQRRQIAGVEARQTGQCRSIEFSSLEDLPGGPHRGRRLNRPAGGFTLSPAESRWARGLVGLSLAALAVATMFFFL
ncbi:MAG: hypothetical protein AB8I08_17725 [Sandaracinaceae bacterium]